jgi:hypothetical protein
MEFILVHKPIGALPPEVMKLTMEMAKKLAMNPQEFVPGGKCVSSYYALGAQAVYCTWDVPKIESLAPLLRNMSVAGWNTEVIPVEKAETAMVSIEKAMQDMMAQMKGK